MTVDHRRRGLALGAFALALPWLGSTHAQTRTWPPRAAYALGMLAFLVQAKAVSRGAMSAYADIGRRWQRDGSPFTEFFNRGFESARASTGGGRDRLAAERLAAEQMHELLLELAQARILSEPDYRALSEQSRPRGPGPEERALMERNAREAAAADRYIAVTPKVHHVAAALETARRSAAEHGLEVRTGPSKYFENYRRSEGLDDRQVMVGPIPPRLHQRLILSKDGLSQALGRYGPTANTDKAEFERGQRVHPAR